MKIFIKSTSAITPQETFNKKVYLKEWALNEGAYLQAVQPKYRDILDPKLARRMSKIIKMGVAAAKSALTEANVEIPEAIIVGTGLGCIDDTQKFLKNIIDSDEGVLSPTAFIQSTHNTIAGQIALTLKCPNYNFTYTNRGHSFENALMDACMQINEGKNHVLLGASEEATDTSFEFMYKMGCVGDLTKADGPTFGEGASFFVLSNSSAEIKPFIKDVQLSNNVTEAEQIEELQQLLSRNSLAVEDIDVLLTGRIDHVDKPHFYDAVEGTLKNKPTIAFKKVSGEHFTASGYAVHLAAMMLERQDYFNKNIISGNLEKPLKHVLIYNHYKGINHSLMLLSI